MYRSIAVHERDDCHPRHYIVDPRLLPSGNPICSLWNNNFIRVVESPFGLVVKRKCVSLHKLQYCNVSCVLDNKLLYKDRWHYYCILLLTYLIIYYNVFCFVSCLVSLHGDQCRKCTARRNGGFLPGVILLTQCYYHGGTRLNVIRRFCICSL